MKNNIDFYTLEGSKNVLEIIDNAINYAKKVVSYWNKNDISTTYEVFDVYEV